MDHNQKTSGQLPIELFVPEESDEYLFDEYGYEEDEGPSCNISIVDINKKFYLIEKGLSDVTIIG